MAEGAKPPQLVKPRVMHVISHLDLGGAENVAISLAEQLADRYDFSFFAVQGIADNDVGRGMQARLARLSIPVFVGTPLPMKAGGPLHAGAKLAARLRSEQPDVVHLHTEVPETAYAVGARLLGPRKAKVLRTVHNSTLWPAWGRIGRWVERGVGGAGVVAVSRASLEGLRTFRAHHGLPPVDEARCRVVYNGIAPVEQAEAGDAGQAGRADGSPARVLFAGRLEPQKGADLLPAIFERASALTEKAAQLSIVGDGVFAPTLRAWAGRGAIRWAARASPPIFGLAAALGSYDVVIMPSRFEGFGLLAAEALLAGTPVVATRAPGLSEVFPAGYPLLAEPEDVGALAALLARAIDDPKAAREAVAPYRTVIADRFSLQGMARRYDQTYRELLGGAESWAAD